MKSFVSYKTMWALVWQQDGNFRAPVGTNVKYFMVYLVLVVHSVVPTYCVVWTDLGSFDGSSRGSSFLPFNRTKIPRRFSQTLLYHSLCLPASQPPATCQTATCQTAACHQPAATSHLPPATSHHAPYQLRAPNDIYRLNAGGGHKGKRTGEESAWYLPWRYFCVLTTK